MIVYDVTCMESFLNVKSWLIELEEHFLTDREQQREESFILVGNKADLEHSRVVKKERGMELAQAYGLAFIETSALSGRNVSHSFQILTSSNPQFL